MKEMGLTELHGGYLKNERLKKNLESPPFPGSMFTALWKKIK